MKKFSVLVVDDERLAREELKLALRGYPDFEVVGEAANADDTEFLLKEHLPDVLFLDIQMPERSGLDLLESIDTTAEIVFITAFDQYAVKAFELEALDYLVKPVRQERLAKTMDKLRTRLLERRKNDQVQRLFIRENDRYFFIDISGISLVESSGNYVRIHLNGRKHYLKRSLTQMENLLDPLVFFRINRNEIINTNFISEARREDNGRMKLILRDGEILEVSTRQSTAFRNRDIKFL